MSEPYVPSTPEEAQFLLDYREKLARYPRNEVTVDVVLLTIRSGRLSVLLIKRGGHPYKDQWALPGGFVNQDEDLATAAARELVEETNLTTPAGYLEQLGTYGDPYRDPRARIVSVAYLALLPEVDTPEGGDDATEARFWAVDDIIEEGLPLAFDHAKVLADGLERAASKLEYTSLATAFCGPTFTIGELRRVYETVWGSQESGPNFHRKVRAVPGFVAETGEVTEPQGRGKPGQLFTAGPTTYLQPPMVRSTSARFIPSADGRTLARDE